MSIELKNINKSFYSAEVLKDINLAFKPGEIHVLCGENGAGKSTLIKIIAGLYKPTSGEIYIEGKAVEFASTKESEKAGIAIVYQELSLCPTVSVAENIFLNREYGKYFMNKREMSANTKKYTEEIGLVVNPNALVKDLPIAQMQMVQIAKALSQNAKFIIFDEPCSSLTESESEKLFDVMLDLKLKGVGIIYIDHRIENFKRIGDKITVLRDGKTIDTVDVEDFDKDKIIQMMVGRNVSQLYHKTHKPKDRVVLEVKNLTNKRIKNISFSVREGEVFGLGGMVGAGRSEIIRAIFGADAVTSKSEIILYGTKIKKNSPIKSIRNGMGYIPEDRKLQGLLLKKDIPYNISLAFLDLINKGLFANESKCKKVAQEQSDALKINMVSKRPEVAELSGGNQQKVVLGKWLMNKDIQILLLDEPTRGVDVGVKAEIYKLIDELSSNGVTIILVTSELSELIGTSDRIAVIKNGTISGILEEAEFSKENIMRLCI
jgi:ribose transport system ATP-binding protein